MLPVTVLTVVVITVVYNKDIPKGSRTTSKVSQFVHSLTQKTRYFSGSYKMHISRFNLHHPVLKFLVCVDVGDSLFILFIFGSVLKFQKNLFYLVYWSASSQILC